MKASHCQACGQPAPLADAYWCGLRCRLIYIRREATRQLRALDAGEEPDERFIERLRARSSWSTWTEEGVK